MNSDAFKNRLKIAMDGASNLSFATKCELSEGTIRRYLRGEAYPPLDTLEVIAHVSGCNLGWLASGEGPIMRGDSAPATQVPDRDIIPPGEGFVQVPRYEIAASAGGGTLVHSEQIVDYMTFRAEWLRTNLGMTPSDAAVISVAGDSMEPYLTNGDLILIDMGVERIENDSVYVLQFGDALQIKRVQKKSDGTVIVKSDNARYEPEVFHNESAERLRVIGRLVRRLVR